MVFKSHSEIFGHCSEECFETALSEVAVDACYEILPGIFEVYDLYFKQILQR